MQYREYDFDHPGSFTEEWGLHRGGREWWYATGILHDARGGLYSWQFTIMNISLYIMAPKVIMLALTDYQTGTHHYLQQTRWIFKDLEITTDRLRFADLATLQKDDKGMRLSLRHKSFSLELSLDYGKGAFWHCDEGRLQMALPGKKQTTLYYSYPNMPSQGTLTLIGQKMAVTGKAWFDRQGGTYSLMDRRTHWEWFSLRFFDEEEMMLFTFPQSSYQDGTYITSKGVRHRLREYTITATEQVVFNGLRWSSAWTLHVPGLKEEHYTIAPIQKGHMNFAYFEELCTIRNSQGEQVGWCFAELLPGVLNERMGNRLLSLIKRVETSISLPQ